MEYDVNHLLKIDKKILYFFLYKIKNRNELFTIITIIAY
jgi:hypothetical protein